MHQRRFKQVDVFSETAYLGNPVAVVLDGSGLDTDTMQRFARWANLSETTFVLPPIDAALADYRLRIFTPHGELPFAGHPTLGSCHAWLEAGGQPRLAGCVVQESASGLVQVRMDSRVGLQGRRQLAFAAPPLQRRALEPDVLQAVLLALGLSRPGQSPATQAVAEPFAEPFAKLDTQVLAAQWLDNGPVWLALLLESVETVLALTPDHAALARLGIGVGVAAIAKEPALPATKPDLLIRRANREAAAFASTTLRTPPATSETSPEDGHLEVRFFAAAVGIAEDPITGSLNASLAQWLIADGYMPPLYTARQGQCLGRGGTVQVKLEAATGSYWIGGDCLTCIDGTVLL